MAFPIMLAVTAGLELGLPMIKRLFGTGKFGKWLGVFEQAANGVVGAVGAVEKLKEFEKTGKTPTNAELDDVLAESRKLHDEIQK
jgi:hypothetical protein